MLSSIGKLRGGPEKVYLEVDHNIVELCRALIPIEQRPQKQKYAPHITIVRNELFVWNTDILLSNDRKIEFTYDPNVIAGDVYWWLRCWSPGLTSLRLDLGLPASSIYSRPPNNEDCFHITIGNTKSKICA